MATGSMASNEVSKIFRTTALAMLAIVVIVLFFRNSYDVGEFALKEVTGAATDSGTLSFTITYPSCVRNISMYSGWNLISIVCAQNDTSLTTVLSPIGGNYSSVEAYYASDNADPWKKYDPSVPPFINDLNTIDEVHGYWFNMSANDTLDVVGDFHPETDISLLSGWNLPGYPSNTTKTISDALTSISGNYSSVEAYYASDNADPWKKYDPSVPPFINDLNNIAPEYGYWFNMSANDTWEVYGW